MDELQTHLLDERAIRRQLSFNCRAVDRLDVDLWRSLWHPDSELDDEVRGVRGAALDLADRLTPDYASWAVHSHQVTSSAVEIDGDRAVSETYVTAILRGHQNDAGEAVDDHHRLTYLDHWSKRDGRWAIDRRRVTNGLSWHQVVTAGRVGRWTRRDREDPSYELFASLGGEDSAGFDTLMAEREIRGQLHNYCRAVDRFDVPLWRGVWHDDGTLDYGDVGERGRAADMAEHMTLDHYPWASHTHQSTSSIIAVRGDRAVSETYSTNILLARLSISDELIDSHYRGRYLDTWSKRNGRWAIDHRRAVSDLGWDQVCIGGSVGLRAHRDREDPSYKLFASLLATDLESA